MDMLMIKTGAQGRLAAGWSDPTRPEILRILLRRRWVVLLVLAACMGGAYAWLKHATPQYTSAARLRVRPDNPRLLGEAEPLRSSDDVGAFLAGEAAVIASDPVLSLALDKEDLKALPGIASAVEPVAELRKRVKVGVGRKDGIISVQAEAPVPEDAARMVRAVVAAYIEREGGRRNDTSEKMLEVLLKEKRQSEEAIAGLSDRMLQLVKEGGAGMLQGRENGASQELAAMKESLRSAQLETIGAESMHAQAMAPCLRDEALLKQFEAMKQAGATLVGTETEAAQLRLAIADVELKIQELSGSRQTLVNHPQYKTLQGQLDRLKVMYAVSSHNRLEQARQRESRLREAVEKQQEIWQQNAARAAEYAKLESERARHEKLCDQLDGRINEIKASGGAGALNISVLEPAKAAVKPSSPDKVRILLLGLAAGLILGGLLAYAREMTDPRLRSVEQIHQSTGLPVLGAVPRLPHLRSRALPGPLAGAVEAFRIIRAGIHLAGMPGGARTLLVTSPQHGDGKTTMASGLGAVLAQSGQRVLVIDADLRRPSQHAVFSVPQGPGLTDVLSGRCILEDAVRPTALEGLDVLPSGAISDDPLAMLSHARMRQALQEAAGAYDVVLVDSPPLNLSIDARILAGACDVSLMVVGLRRTDRNVVEKARDGLLDAGARILGVVVNKAPRRGGSDLPHMIASQLPAGRPARSLPLLREVRAGGHSDVSSTQEKEIDPPDSGPSPGSPLVLRPPGRTDAGPRSRAVGG